MGRISRLFFILLAFSNLSATAEEKYSGPAFSIDQAVYGLGNDFKEIRSIAEKIIRDYPPQKFIYVGLGRSPIPVIAMLKALRGDDVAMNISMSNVGEMHKYTKIPGGMPSYYRQSALLQHHIAVSLPSNVELNGRDLLIIDYASTGNGISEAKLQFEAALLRKYPESSSRPKIKALALTRSIAGLYQTFKNGIDRMFISSRLNSHLRFRRYRKFAEYSQFYIDPIINYYDPPEHDPSAFEELKYAYAKRLNETFSTATRVKKLLTTTPCSDLLTE